MAGIALSGIGVVTAYGRGTARLWQAMAAGASGLAPIARFDAAALGVGDAGLVPDRNAAAWGERSFVELALDFALDAAREALAEARLTPGALPAARIGLVVGTSLGDQATPLHRMTAALADALGVDGPRVTVSTACTSSANALGIGAALIASGAADVIIAGGTDVLSPLVSAGFHALGVLSAVRCAPFSSPPGTSLGEGAGFAILERPATARARGAPSGRRLLGVGLSADAFHDTGPDPTGAGIASAMRGALAAAGLAPEAIDYVNAHGTGTAANDPAEWRAIRQVLGPRASSVPISSSKSFLGHAQGAAGIVELIATLVAHAHGAVPPTHNHIGARPNSPPDPVAQPTPRPGRWRTAMCNSAAFGGANCAVLIGNDDGDPGPSIEPGGGPAIDVVGLGCVGAHGTTLDALADALAATTTGGGPAAPYRIEELVPSADPRGLDPATRHLVVAVARALDDAGAARGRRREATGLVIGTDRVSPESYAALHRTIDERGMRFLSASAFSRMVLNAPVGTASRLHALRGPLSTVSAGDASGLLAIAYAAELLAAPGGPPSIVAGAVDESHPRLAGPTDAEGAAGLVLAARRGGSDDRTGAAAGRPVALAGWAIRGPDALGDAAGDALASAGLAGVPIDALVADRAAAAAVSAAHPAVDRAARIDPTARFGRGAGTAAALGAAAAALLIRRGAIDSALIASAGDATAAVALVLRARPEEPP